MPEYCCSHSINGVHFGIRLKSDTEENLIEKYSKHYEDFVVDGVFLKEFPITESEEKTIRRSVIVPKHVN